MCMQALKHTESTLKRFIELDSVMSYEAVVAQICVTLVGTCLGVRAKHTYGQIFTGRVLRTCFSYNDVKLCSSHNLAASF